MPQDIKIVIRDNVRALLGLRDGVSGVGLLLKLGFANGSASRILEGETSFGIDILAQLAKALDVEPWQLCVPGLSRESVPSLHKQPKLSPGVAQIAAAMEKMDEAGRDTLAKVAEALIRPPPAPLEESSMLPTGSPARVQ